MAGGQLSCFTALSAYKGQITLANQGTIQLGASLGTGTLVLQGGTVIDDTGTVALSNPVTLAGPVFFNVAAGSSLWFRNNVDLGGKSSRVQAKGTVDFQGTIRHGSVTFWTADSAVIGLSTRYSGDPSKAAVKVEGNVHIQDVPRS
jgi:hypothetical protein